MNKIYKIIWSKVKNCYVVTSELAKNHTKSPKTGVVNSAVLNNAVLLSLYQGRSAIDISLFDDNEKSIVNYEDNNKSDFKITVAAIVKNEAKNVPQWVQAARSCADEIVVVDTGSTDGTVERFADYGIKCFHYKWNDDFASAKNFMISLCHGDWIVLLDGDEWFREGCDVRKAIAKHHNNPIEKAIIADWICLDSSRNNMIMFSGGAVRAFRNHPSIRYFRKVHENLTLGYENFVFEPEFKMYHTGYSGDVNRSKHERNLRIMRTMFDFDNGKVEYPTDWRYVQDTYAGLGNYEKSMEASDKMIAYGVQEYSAASWITRFNVLFAMKADVKRMDKEFEYCFKTVPSVSGFRFLATIYYLKNGIVNKGLDNYIEGLRMLMGPQDKVALEHTYWRMYLPEASMLASMVYLQNKQVEAALYACKVSEQYCGKTVWTDDALINIRKVSNNNDKDSLKLIADKILPLFNFSKKAVLASAFASSLAIGLVGVPNQVFAACCNLNEVTTNQTTGNDSTVTAGENNTANSTGATVSGGCCNTAGCWGYFFESSTEKDATVLKYISPSSTAICNGYVNVNYHCFPVTITDGQYSSVSGGCFNFALGCYSSVLGGQQNGALGDFSTIGGGQCNVALGCYSFVNGGIYNIAKCEHSGVTGGEKNVANGNYSVIVGGECNTVERYYHYMDNNEVPYYVPITCNKVVNGYYQVDASHRYEVDEIEPTHSVIVGGNLNIASNCNTVVVGGDCNSAVGYRSTVTGGSCNISAGGRAVATGGWNNRAYGSFSTLAGGGFNKDYGEYSTIAGGYCNKIDDYTQYGSIFGGYCNRLVFNTNHDANSSAAVIAGGYGNTVHEYGDFASVFGGTGNAAYCDYSVAVGGSGNKAKAESSVVIGGQGNVIGNNAHAGGYYSVIAGGYCNNAMGCNTASLGGLCNIVSGEVGTIVGGSRNKVGNGYSYVDDNGNINYIMGYCDDVYWGEIGNYDDPDYYSGNVIDIGNKTYPITEFFANCATAVGGDENRVFANSATVLGGQCNIIDAGCSYYYSGACYATISGGVCNQILGNKYFYYNDLDGVKRFVSIEGSGVDFNNTYSYFDNEGIEHDELSIMYAQGASISAGKCNTALGDYSSVSGGECNAVFGNYSSITGGQCNLTEGDYATITGGMCNLAKGIASVVVGGENGVTYADKSVSIGGGITGDELDATIATNSVAIGSGATTTRDYEVSIGSVCAPVKLGGNMNVTGTNTVSDGTTTKTWSQILAGGGGSGSFADIHLYAGTGSTANAVSIDGNTKVVLADGTTVVDTLSIKGAGSTKVISDANGTITIGACFADGVVLAGCSNTASGCYSSVSAGMCNTAGVYYYYMNDMGERIFVHPNDYGISNDKTTYSFGGTNYPLTAYNGYNASVNGGKDNLAVGDYSSVLGGHENAASGLYATVSGGECNVASGRLSSIAGGCLNVATGCSSSVTGGTVNTAGVYYSYVRPDGVTEYIRPNDGRINGNKITVNGTDYDLTTYEGNFASVTGGCFNLAIGESSSVTGGMYNVASGCGAVASGGYSNVASGGDSVVLGGMANASHGADSVVVGGCHNVANYLYSSIIGGTCNSTYGYFATVSGGVCNVAAGENSWVAGGSCGVAYANESSAIGGGIAGISTCALTALGSVAIGKGATTTRNYEVSIGSVCAPVTLGGNMNVTGTNTVTDGVLTKTWTDILSTSSGTVPYIGINSTATCNKTGEGATGLNAIAIGPCTISIETSSIAIGDFAHAGSSSDIAIGYSASTPMDEPLADWYDIAPHSNIAIGDNAYVSGDAETTSGVSSIAIGDEANVYGNYGISIGLESSARNDGVAIGEHASSYDYSVGIGSYASGSGLHSIAIGNSAYTQSDYSISLGTCSSTSGDNAIAIGKDVDVEGDNGVALGTNAYVHYNITNAVALGADSSAVDSNVLSIGKAAVGTAGQDGYVPEYTRKIQHVTAGTADTDAVNVAQLNTAIANAGGGSGSGSNIEFVSTGNDYWIPTFDYSSLSNEQKRVYDAYNVQTQADYDALKQDDDKINRTGQGAVGDNSIAIGLLAKANTLSDIAIGDMATTGTGYGGSNIAIGKLAYAESDYSFNTAIGYKSEASGGTSIAIGDGAKTVGPASVTIGSQSTTTKSYSVTIGPDAHTTSYNSVTIGDRATNAGSQSIAIGNGVIVPEKDSNNNSVSLATAVGSCSRVVASIAEAYGYNAVAAGSNSTAVGNNSLANSFLSDAFGYYSHAVAEGATAIGPSTFAMGCYSTAVGAYSYANAKNSVSVGTGTGGGFDSSYGAKTPYSIAIGSSTIASGVSGTGDDVAGDSIVIGRQSNAGSTGDNLVIGLRSNANAGGSRVIGSYSNANGTDDLVFGSYSTAGDLESVAIGKYMLATGAYSVAIGSCSTATKSRTVSIGKDTKAEAIESIAIGNCANVADDGGATGSGIAIGRGAYAKSPNTISMGTISNANTSDAIAIGNISKVDNSQGGVALGHYAEVKDGSIYGVSVGDSSSVNGRYSVAVGQHAVVNGESSVAVGGSTQAGCYSTIVGYNSSAGCYGTTLGYNARITGLNSANSIVLGANSVASECNVLSLGYDEERNAQDEVTKEELTRRILHVTAGINDTDAVNVKQLNDAIANIGSGGSGGTVTADGLVEKDNTGIVTGGTVWDALNKGRHPDYLDRIGSKTFAFGGSYNIVEGTDSMSIGANASDITGSRSLALGSMGANIQSDHSVVLNSVDLNYDLYKNETDYYNRHLVNDGGSVVMKGSNGTAIGTYAFTTLNENAQPGEVRWNSHGVTTLTGNADIAIGGTYNTINGDTSIIMNGVGNTVDGNASVSINSSYTKLTGDNDVSAGGFTNYVSGKDSFVVGGTNASVKGNMSGSIGSSVSNYAEASAIEHYRQVVGDATGMITDITGNGSLAIGNYGVIKPDPDGEAAYLAGGKTSITGDNSIAIGGTQNTVQSNKNIVMGTTDSTIASCADSSIIIGGCNLSIDKAPNSLILSGCNNHINSGYDQYNSDYSMIVGGTCNAITSHNDYNMIIGGCQNSIIDNGEEYPSRGQNMIVNSWGSSVTNSNYSTIVGGGGNVVKSNRSTVLGFNNTVKTGANPTFITGSFNTIGEDDANGYEGSAVDTRIIITGDSNKAGAEVEGLISGDYNKIKSQSVGYIYGWSNQIGYDDYNSAYNSYVYGSRNNVFGDNSYIYGKCNEIGDSAEDVLIFGKCNSFNYVGDLMVVGSCNSFYPNEESSLSSSLIVGNYNNFESETYNLSLYGNSNTAKYYSRDTYVAGDSNQLGEDSYYNLVLGRANVISDGVSESTAIGLESNVSANCALAISGTIGANGEGGLAILGTANATDAIAIGHCSFVTGVDSIAIGKGQTIAGCNSVAFGNNNKVATNTTDVFTLGNSINTTASNVVVLGKQSAGSEANTISVGHKATDLDVNGQAYGTVLNRKIVNVAAGTLSASSTDAVIGAQLYATNENIAGFASDINRNKTNIAALNTSVTAALGSVSSTSSLVSTLNDIKADASLNNLTAAGRNVIATAAINAVQEYMASQNGSTEPETPSAPMMYSSNPNTLSVTNAGNGSLHVGEGSYVNGTSSIAIGVGNQVNANNSGAFGDPSIINADESYVLGNDDTINTGAMGSFVVGNDSVSSAKGGLTFGSNNNLSETAENSIALGNNINITGKNSVALGNGSIATEDNVVSVGSDTVKRKITNVADGIISKDSADVVTGSQLFVTNEKIKTNEKAIAQKADLNASNINVDDWATKLGIGTVSKENTGLVNGGTVYSAIQQVKDNQFIQQNGDTLSIGGNVGGNTISVANNTGEGRVITDVITDPNNTSSVANVGYVQSVSESLVNSVNNSLGQMDTKVNKVGANAAAMASLTPASFEGDEKWSLSAGVGNYKGETAGAVGAFYRPAENVLMNVRGSFGNNENMVGAAVSVSLSKGDILGVTKRQLAKEVVSLKQNQNIILQAREQDQRRIAEQDRRIEELESLVHRMAEQMNQNK